MRRKHFKRSVYLILLSLFIAVTAPMYILCYGIYQWGHSMTTNEIMQSLHSRSGFFMKTLENEIIRIRELQYECLNDENLFYFVNAWPIITGYERINYLLSLQKRLSLMYNSSTYIANVSVWIPGMDTMISAKRGVDPITDEWKRIIAAEADLSPASILYMNGEMYLCSAYPTMPADREATPLYILVVQLSSQDIIEQFMSFNMYPEGGTVLSNAGQQYFIVAGDDIGLSDQIHPDNAVDTNFSIRGLNGQKYIVAKNASDYLNMELYTYVPEKLIYGVLYRYRDLFLIFIVIAFILIAAYLWAVNVLVNRPIKILIQSFTRVEQGEVRAQIQHKSNDEFSYLYNAFNQMTDSLENMLEINYRQKMLAQEAELRQLQAQINPHFLHNSFFILYRMAKDEDYENITEFLTYLSEYYRYITRNAQMEVSLGNEISHANRYAQIQHMRFKKRISVDFEPLPQHYADMMVPRLIVQPILENAFDHGLKDVPTDGHLSVRYEEQDETFIIRVEDNGEGMEEDALATLRLKMERNDDTVENTGVVNIHKRLRLKFGDDYGLCISRLENGGMRWEILLPGPRLRGKLYGLVEK